MDDFVTHLGKSIQQTARRFTQMTENARQAEEEAYQKYHENIIRMAREAGLTVVGNDDPQGWIGAHAADDESLERFAALVAAAEREKWTNEAEALALGVRELNPFASELLSDLSKAMRDGMDGETASRTMINKIEEAT